MDYLIRQKQPLMAYLSSSINNANQSIEESKNNSVSPANNSREFMINSSYTPVIIQTNKYIDNETTEEEFNELEAKAFEGNLEAVHELMKLSSGIKSSLCNNVKLIFASKQILKSLSSVGPENVKELLFVSFPNNCNILEGIIYSDSKFAEEASAKLVENFFNSNSTSYSSSKLLKESKLIKKVLKNLKKSPDKNVDLIGKIANITGYGIEILADLAQNKPGNITGKKAARALSVIFINQSGRKAEFALEYLKDAVKNGNIYALMIITNIAKMGPQIKALQAVDALYEIAMDINSYGSVGTNTAIGCLTDIAEDNKVSTKVRIRAIQHLGDLILQGKDGAYSATDALIRIVENPVNNQIIRNESIETIIKISEQKPGIIERSNNLLYKIVNNKIPCAEKHKRSAQILLKKSFSS